MRFAQSSAAPAVAPLPAWARPAPRGAALADIDAGLYAGAALAHLDAILRADAAFLGAWRNRLALIAAAASVKCSGRREAASDLRDAWLLRRPGDDPGPAGGHLSAWRNLARSSPALSLATLRRAAEGFGLTLDDERLAEMLRRAAAACRDGVNPLHGAAHVAAEVSRLSPPAELLGLWLADLVLAYRLRWPFPLPLLVSWITSPAVRAGAGGHTLSSDPAWPQRVTWAYAQAAVAAIDLAGELSRRATKLAAVAPTLRAKGAAAVVQSLLDDDALAPGAPIAGMSDRGLRRLCERLVECGAVRELTGRPTFRLYGL